MFVILHYFDFSVTRRFRSVIKIVQEVKIVKEVKMLKEVNRSFAFDDVFFRKYWGGLFWLFITTQLSCNSCAKQARKARGNTETAEKYFLTNLPFSSCLFWLLISEFRMITHCLLSLQKWYN